MLAQGHKAKEGGARVQVPTAKIPKLAAVSFPADPRMMDKARKLLGRAESISQLPHFLAYFLDSLRSNPVERF